MPSSAAANTFAGVNVEVTCRGPVESADVDVARTKVGELERLVDGTHLEARVVLIEERNPRIERAARAEAELNIAGRPVHARVAAESMRAAIDELADRLGRRLRRHIDRIVTSKRRAPRTEQEEPPAVAAGRRRPERLVRPAGERAVVRRKSFAIAAETAAEAAAGMEALDHDFYLFHDAETGADAVIYRDDDSRLAVIVPRGAETRHDQLPRREESRMREPIPVDTAVGEMGELEHRFLYFVNAATGRGNVIYLRYDGDYGLIEPAA